MVGSVSCGTTGEKKALERKSNVTRPKRIHINNNCSILVSMTKKKRMYIKTAKVKKSLIQERKDMKKDFFELLRRAITQPKT